MEALEPSTPRGEDAKWYLHSGKRSDSFFKKLSIHLLYDLEMKAYIHTKTRAGVFTAASFTQLPIGGNDPVVPQQMNE